MQGPAEKNTDEGVQRRIGFVGMVIVGLLVVLGVRIWDLQIRRWAEFRAKSEGNRLHIQRLQAPRGTIYGRLGDGDREVLAKDQWSPDLVFVPAECETDAEAVCRRLEQLVGIDGDALLAEIRQKEKEKQPYKQIVAKRDVPRGVLARIEEYAYAFPGVRTVIRPQRRYPWGKVGGQVMGYLNELTRQEWQEKMPGYRLGDYVGRAGLERMYEELLHGVDGHKLVTKYSRGSPQVRTDASGNVHVEVDDFGHSLVEEESRLPRRGSALYVTLDIGLQERAEALLEGKEGAIVVLDAERGEVLALASAPGYDPGIFVMRGMNQARRDLLASRPSRMKNRAYQEGYAPGSVFKVLMASVGLETGKLRPEETFFCRGQFQLNEGARPFRCWKRGGHGDVAVVDALAFSCDVFFYNLGLRLGVDVIHAWAAKLGFGARTQIDLPAEATGLNPSREWWVGRLRERIPDRPWDQRWFPGDTLNLSIGQGLMSTTPLQNAVMMAAIVNGGRRVRPYLNRDRGPEVSEPLFSEETLKWVRRGLRKCVDKGPPAPTGTGRAVAIEGMAILGKTGSAQVVGRAHQQQYEREEDLPKAIRDHAWFVAGVLDREPAIAVCILIEHGHHGSSVAAPLAKDLIAYFYATRGRPGKDSVKLSQQVGR